ncbi:MAG: polysaccharide biosynthesis C-terminal domain-containing protein, partial [Oscillospiraceae bacterium]|nr:polysaccharide biosynthesis C-terminal domain-containing protein [Oscillospiraceae bacterium]
MEDLQQKKFRRMTGEPVERLVAEMAVPSVISMLVSAFYNMADTFFIGKLSTEATGAVGIVFSYMAFIQAFSFFFGHGSGSYISRELGRKNRRAAQEMAANGFFSCLFFGLALAAVGFVFMEPLLYALGATPTILPEAKKYFFYILLGTPGMMGSLVLNNQMRLQGNARLGMFGVLTGAVLNLILDPILIFGFEMGISGAAVATAFSQTVGFVVLLCLCGRGD